MHDMHMRVQLCPCDTMIVHMNVYCVFHVAHDVGTSVHIYVCIYIFILKKSRTLIAIFRGAKYAKIRARRRTRVMNEYYSVFIAVNEADLYKARRAEKRSKEFQNTFLGYVCYKSQPIHGT